MFIALVYRPEASEQVRHINPFDGIEVYGIGGDEDAVNRMIDQELEEHPTWNFNVSQVALPGETAPDAEEAEWDPINE